MENLQSLAEMGLKGPENFYDHGSRIAREQSNIQTVWGFHCFDRYYFSDSGSIMVGPTTTYLISRLSLPQFCLVLPAKQWALEHSSGLSPRQSEAMLQRSKFELLAL